MRNSLWTRLMGGFLGVILLGVIVMVVSVQFSTDTQLRRRVLSNDVAQANALTPLLATYYSDNDGWNGVEAYLASAPQPQAPPADQIGPGMMEPGGMMENWGDWMGMTRASGPLADRVVVLKFESTAGLPNIQADEQRITQVLFNLMSNALRHTPAGGAITISAEAREDRALISVRDTGTGIPPKTCRTSSSASTVRTVRGRVPPAVQGWG